MKQDVISYKLILRTTQRESGEGEGRPKGKEEEDTRGKVEEGGRSKGIGGEE